MIGLIWRENEVPMLCFLDDEQMRSETNTADGQVQQDGIVGQWRDVVAAPARHDAWRMLDA